MTTIKLRYGSEESRAKMARLIREKIPAGCYTMKLQAEPVDFILTNYVLVIESANLQALLKIRQLHLSGNPEAVKSLKSSCKAYKPRTNKSKADMPTKKATPKKAVKKAAPKKAASPKKAAPKKKVAKKNPATALKRIGALKKELAQDRKKITALTRKLKTKTKKLSKIRRTSKQTRRKRK